ncbi:MAG: hypothetical protein Q8L76_04305, partial [Cypionkella sp.]|nr:hypothetical protein [Cypionkella sp.]
MPGQPGLSAIVHRRSVLALLGTAALLQCSTSLSNAAWADTAAPAAATPEVVNSEPFSFDILTAAMQQRATTPHQSPDKVEGFFTS